MSTERLLFLQTYVCLGIPGLGLQLLQCWSSLSRGDGQAQGPSFAVYTGSGGHGATKCWVLLGRLASRAQRTRASFSVCLLPEQPLFGGGGDLTFYQ